MNARCTSPRRISLSLCVAIVGTLVNAQTVFAEQAPAGARVVSVIRQVLADAPGECLTTEVVEFGPGAAAPALRRAGTVFVVVLSGTLRLREAGGNVVDRHSGDSWTEPLGAVRTRMENPSTSMPARLLSVFVAPTRSEYALAER